MVAVFVFTLVMAGAMAGFLHVVRSEARQTLQMDLISDAQRVATLLRTTIRVSGIGEMLAYPTNGPHIAVSYPIPGATNTSGDAVLDAAGQLVWRETIILHAWPHDAPTELRMTRFNPRDNTLSGAARAAQLEAVVLDGHGANAANGANSATRVLSALQPRFNMQLDGRTYNFYAPADTKEANVVLGGVRVRPGANSIRFRTVGQADASAGYGLRLDQIKISPSGLPLEAEALAITSQNGASAETIEDATGRWSGYRAMQFSATSAGSELAFSFYNDTWHETAFHAPGCSFEKCVTVTDLNTGSMGTSLRPSGRDVAWVAEFQSGTVGSGVTNDLARGAAVRVIVRGGQAAHGPHVLAAGDGCRVTFRASNHPYKALYILDAFISEAADHDNPGPDIVAGTTTRLRFGTPANQRNWSLLAYGASEQTVPLSFPIDLLKSYVISFRVYAWPFMGWGYGNPWSWSTAAQTNRFDSFMIPGSSSPNEADTRAALWSGRQDLVAVPAILGVSGIETTYADNATYCSRIVDTRLTGPGYQDLVWTATLPSDATSVAFKVRTGNDPELADAPEWGDLEALTTSGEAVPAAAGNGRYAQVQVILGRDATQDLIPDLHDFTLRWLGESASVDFGGVFERYANGGIVEVLVNDEPPVSSMRTDLTVSGCLPHGVNTTWALGIEVSPRN